MITISSQEYRNEDTILEKIENEDYEVFVSPVFEIDGEEYRVILDGHHSYEAAARTGAEIEYTELDSQDNDTVGYIESGDIDSFLEANFVDASWYDVETGKGIF